MRLSLYEDCQYSFANMDFAAVTLKRASPMSMLKGILLLSPKTKHSD